MMYLKAQSHMMYLMLLHVPHTHPHILLYHESERSGAIPCTMCPHLLCLCQASLLKVAALKYNGDEVCEAVHRFPT